MADLLLFYVDKGSISWDNRFSNIILETSCPLHIMREKIYRHCQSW